MKNYKSIIVTKTEQEIDSMSCDKCGKTVINDKNFMGAMELQEWFRYNFVGGYNSIFGDMDEYEVDLCQECMKELLGPYLRYVGNYT